ncbi:MAG: MgtC/SapB family protein [Bythopirellula sp.]|nr:MgtC/SapB family protein [Bythopirellula sp.]
MDSSLLTGLAVALGLGLLVGMQREWKESTTAGVRTFTLITLLGALSSTLGGGVAPWLSAAGLLAVTALLMLANISKLRQGEKDIGLTTEVAALLMYVIGAAAGQGYIVPAVVVGGVAAVLLHWKQPIHSFIESMGESDLKGVFQLVLIGLVILPILPDETYGPYDVLNPYRIWLMVVLIVGISLCAYVIQRILGERIGALLGGLLGGLISSTATTVSYARRTAGRPNSAWIAALVILLASTVVNARALFEIGVVAPNLLSYVIPPLGILALGMSILCGLVYFWARGEQIDESSHENPAQLQAAIIFGLLYAAVLFVVAAVRDHFGDRALYAVAVISGLTDMDAITLSAAQMFREERIDGSTSWRIIMIAMLANLVFKAGAVMVLGSRKLSWLIAVLFGLSLVLGVGLLVFWPDWTVDLTSLTGNAKP